MGKKFNVTGTCTPDEDYMVDITEKLVEIKKMVDARAYFTINRGRQYGKTTTLHQLESYLSAEYLVISISFEDMDIEEFENAHTFSQTFISKIQLLGYMSRFQKGEGYLLTFDFRKNKQLTHEWVIVDGSRKILDVVV